MNNDIFVNEYLKIIAEASKKLSINVKIKKIEISGLTEELQTKIKNEHNDPDKVIEKIKKELQELGKFKNSRTAIEDFFNINRQILQYI